VKTALLSVYDKTGLVDLAHGLYRKGWRLIASGGTAKCLEVAGLSVTSVSAYTNSPEILGGRVKTLHPIIAGGILAKDTSEDLTDLEKISADFIDLVVCNLYPFQETVARLDISLSEAIEQIDIGGVTLIRAAAKNFSRVTVLTDPLDYDPVMTAMNSEQGSFLDTRRQLAIKAFTLTSAYDAAIREYLDR
jgi:phosphoribosylaminoimidazolecarboxamide formyltransferase/IMP cyclohydrolase